MGGLRENLFAKYPDHPELAKLQRRVKLDFLAAILVAIGGFVISALLIQATAHV